MTNQIVDGEVYYKVVFKSLGATKIEKINILPITIKYHKTIFNSNI